MDPVSFAKALLINAACTNAAAVCQNTQGGGVPVDPLIQDTNLQGKGVMVYEEAKIQYAALLRAFQDKTGIWPDPQLPSVPANAPVPNLAALTTQFAPLAQELLPLLSTVPALAPLVGPLQALLGGVTKPVTPPPGSPATAAQPIPLTQGANPNVTLNIAATPGK